MDYNPDTNMLYTGDEAGYLQKWDLTPMLEKLAHNEAIFKARQERERNGGGSENVSAARGSNNTPAQASTFNLTGVESNEEQKIDKDDVVYSEAWKAHNDAINCVTYIPEIEKIASCAFDQHVYIWDAEGDKTERVGSLLLGNKVLPPGATLDAEQRRYKAQWKV